MAKHRLETHDPTSTPLSRQQRAYVDISGQVLVIAGVMTAFAPMVITPTLHIDKRPPTPGTTPDTIDTPHSPQHELYSRPDMGDSQQIGTIGSYTIVCAYPDSIRITGRSTIDKTLLTGYISSEGESVPNATPNCQQ